jgi:hypothetical protein
MFSAYLWKDISVYKVLCSRPRVECIGEGCHVSDILVLNATIF